MFLASLKIGDFVDFIPKPAPQPAAIKQGAQFWTAVYTSIGCERKAQAGIEESGRGTFLPTYKVERLYLRRPIERPLLQRYVLVTMFEQDREWGEINSLDGVERLLTNNDLPLRIPDDDIRELMIAHASGEHDLNIKIPSARYLKYQKRRPRPRHGKAVSKVRDMLDKARRG